MAEKVIDEIQQELDPEKLISRLRDSLKRQLGLYKSTYCDQLAFLKTELEKLTNSSHKAYPDKKKKLNHGMLHKVRDMNAERCLLKMFNSRKHKELDFLVDNLEEQPSEFDLPKREIQKKIQVLEKKREEDVKVILEIRKRVNSIKNEITRARPCSEMVWGICSHPKIREFDPFLWGCVGVHVKLRYRRKIETTIATMTMKSLREKLESIRQQRNRAHLNIDVS